MKIFGIWSNKINKRKFQQAVAYLKRNQNEKLEIVSFNEDCSFAYIFHPNEEFFLEKKKNEFKFIYPDQYSDEYLVNCKDSINSRSNSKTLDCNPLTITFTDNEIKIKSDYFGLKKIFYTKINEDFIFASEMKSIIYYCRENLTINKKGLIEFFLYNFFWGETTFFKEISFLQPKQSITFNTKTKEIESTYFAKYPTLIEFDEERDIPKLANIFINGLKKFTQNGDTVIWLSGGLDSRLILAALKKNNLKISHIINFGYKSNKDNRYARKVVKYLGLDDRLLHYEITADIIVDRALKHLWINEGFSSILNSHLSFGLEEVKKTGNPNLIIFDGYAGDVIFGGSYGDSYPKMEIKLQNKGNKFLIPFLKGDFKEEVENYNYKSFENVMKNNYDQNEKEIRLREFMFFDDYLRKKIASGGPKIGADYGIILTPYFYKDFFNACIKIPIEFRENRTIQKKVMEYLYPEIAKLPTTSLIFTKKGLARKIELFFYYIRRFIEKSFRIKLQKTQIYVDSDEWLRKSKAYYDMISTLVFDDITKKRDFYDLPLLKQMLDDHMKRKNDYGSIFAKLFDFELILRLFVDKESSLRNQLEKNFLLND